MFHDVPDSEEMRREEDAHYKILRILGLFVLAGVLSWVLLLLTGCSSDQALRSAAEADYLARHLACVETYNTKPEIDACRDAVRRDWSPDGGR